MPPNESRLAGSRHSDAGATIDTHAMEAPDDVNGRSSAWLPNELIDDPKAG